MDGTVAGVGERKPSVAVKKLLLCYNPFSGNGRGRKIKQKVTPLLQAAGIEVVEQRSEHAQHFLQCLADESKTPLESAGIQCVACIGGDGTFNEVINGLAKRYADGADDPASASRPPTAAIRIPLALIPGGTGNSFSHDLGFGCDYMSAAQAIIDGHTIACDAGRVDFRVNADGSGCEDTKRNLNQGKDTVSGTRYVHNLVGLGIGVDANIEAERWRCCGPARYDFAALVEISRQKKHEGPWQKFSITGLDAMPVPGKRKKAGKDVKESGESKTGAGMKITQEDVGDVESADKEAVLSGPVVDKLQTWKVELPHGCSLAFVQNTVYGGARLALCPDARIADGYLDFLWGDKLSPMELLGLFDKLKKSGRHVFDDRIMHRRFKTLHVEGEREQWINLDGENYGKTPMTVTCVPKMFTVFRSKAKGGQFVDDSADAKDEELFEGYNFEKLERIGARNAPVTAAGRKARGTAA